MREPVHETLSQGQVAMDLSSFSQVNTWLLEYVYETVWTFFDVAHDVPLALRCDYVELSSCTGLS